MSKEKERPAVKSQSGYFLDSSRPFTSLVFILPMLLAYEGAIVVLGPNAVHNGAAVWLQNFLGAIGLGQFVLLPVLACSLLVGWHYMLRLPWKFSPWALPAMLVECVLWATVLWAIYRGYCGLTGVQSGDTVELAQLFGFFGAGIYEELLFRVLLQSGIAAVMRAAGAPQRACLITAILVTALLFAGAHYDAFVTGGTQFSWTGIVFHAVCGVYLGTLFALRGFGVTAGTHALYNIAVVMIKL